MDRAEGSNVYWREGVMKLKSIHCVFTEFTEAINIVDTDGEAYAI